MAGRPSKYTPELVDEICLRLSSAEPLAVICRDAHMPSPSTVWQWMKDDAAISEAIARARIEGEEALGAQCLEIADMPPPLTAAGGIDSAGVQHAKLRIETRLKLLAKWNPKKWGDKVTQEISGPDGAPVQTSSSIKVEFVGNDSVP